VALWTLAGAQSPAGGYLAGHEPDTLAVVVQAPAPGSNRDLADREIFKSTRALEGTPRWSLAQNDVELGLPAVLKDFSCAAGVSLTPENAPALIKVMRKMAPDLAAAYGRPKDYYKRPRPYLRDAGPICVARSAALDQSFDYPSGHATFAWGWGLILADLMPDRAGAILGRARAFGESRVVCGVHSANAITESRSAGATLFAALQADPDFQKDMAAARAELATLRGSSHGPAPEICAAETALTAKTPW
jgi:acid phosphatase (class A)